MKGLKRSMRRTPTWTPSRLELDMAVEGYVKKRLGKRKNDQTLWFATGSIVVVPKPRATLFSYLPIMCLKGGLRDQPC